MKLTKTDLLLAKQAAKDDNCHSLNRLRIEPGKVVVCDGALLTIAKRPHKGDGFEPYHIPASDALDIAKRTNGDGASVVRQGETVTATTGNTVSEHKPDDRPYPDYERCIPKLADAKARVCISANYLKAICEHALQVQKGERYPDVHLALYGNEESVRIDYTDHREEPTRVTSVVYPIRATIDED
jgi:hypothetical protein